MPKIAIVDTYYPDFLKSWHFNEAATYETELNRLLDFEFGTGRAYSRNLGKLGWDCIDIIANCEPLQRMWEYSYGRSEDTLQAQIRFYDPDVIFFQDLSLATFTSPPRIMAGQCSCPMPPYDCVKRMDVIFSSFPHYLKKFEEAGVRAVFNPLGFEPAVLAPWSRPIGILTSPKIMGDSLIEAIRKEWSAAYRDQVPQPIIVSNGTEIEFKPIERIHDVVFIGGVGSPSHWKRGMETLHAVAEAIPTFKWWGYGVENLPDGPLKEKYQGQAWGLDMYKILLQSKICLNRHGEVSEGYANNMRMFEATGCGALLLTEHAKNLEELFDFSSEVLGYDSAADVVRKIRLLLDMWDSYSMPKDIAANGQARTLRDHTYSQRMKAVSETLKEML